MYSIILKAHINTGHGGRDKMLKEVSKKYANVTRDVVGLFKELCEECQLRKRKVASKGLVIKPLLSKDFISRGQVDLVDMQSLRQGEYKFIMHYQDHLTKFSVLRALTSKRAVEVAYQLLDIFLLLGAPNILQSDNGREFTASVIQELKDLWPDSHIVHGKPRHPQSQGSVERANADIKDMLIAWMRENDTKSWAIGLKFVQFAKNNSFHSGIKRSTYKALFGCDAKMGLSTSSLPTEILSTLVSEDDLLAHLNDSQSESCESSQTVSEYDGGTNSQTTDDDDTDLLTTDDEALIEIHAEDELLCRVCNKPCDDAHSCKVLKKDELLCTVCNKPCDGAHSCKVCYNAVHAICGATGEEEGYGSTVLCQLCYAERVIASERSVAVTSMKQQSEKNGQNF